MRIYPSQVWSLEVLEPSWQVLCGPIPGSQRAVFSLSITWEGQGRFWIPLEPPMGALFHLWGLCCHKKIHLHLSPWVWRFQFLDCEGTQLFSLYQLSQRSKAMRGLNGLLKFLLNQITWYTVYYQSWLVEGLGEYVYDLTLSHLRYERESGLQPCPLESRQ